jgi:hypothetical protein
VEINRDAPSGNTRRVPFGYWLAIARWQFCSRSTDLNSIDLPHDRRDGLRLLTTSIELSR